MTQTERDDIRRKLLDWEQWRHGGVGLASSWRIEASSNSGYRTSTMPINVNGEAERTHEALKAMPEDLRAVLIWNYTDWVWDGRANWHKMPDLTVDQFMDRACGGQTRRTFNRKLDRSEHAFIERLYGRYVPPRKASKDAGLVRMSLF